MRRHFSRGSKSHKKRVLTLLTQIWGLCYSRRMNAFLINLLSEQTTAILLVLGVGFIVFFFFLRREFRYENKANMELIKNELRANSDSVKSELRAEIDSVKSELRTEIDSVKSELRAEIAPIKAALDNHITDTNKKIDRLSDRIDKQNDQFNRLYELLLKEKQNKSSK